MAWYLSAAWMPVAEPTQLPREIIWHRIGSDPVGGSRAAPDLRSPGFYEGDRDRSERKRQHTEPDRSRTGRHDMPDRCGRRDDDRPGDPAAQRPRQKMTAWNIRAV
jgi:hypothetical protein